MKPKVYIETSIPSFYHEVRSEPSMVARRDWTRQWWDNASNQENACNQRCSITSVISYSRGIVVTWQMMKQVWS